MPLKTLQDEQPSLNLTPMIDVVFLLIIFFMVATKFAELERDIELELPEVASASALTSAPKQRVVSVQAGGQLRLDGEDVSLGMLKRQLSAARSEYPQLSVVIRGRCDLCVSAHRLGAGYLQRSKHLRFRKLPYELPRQQTQIRVLVLVSAGGHAERAAKRRHHTRTRGHCIVAVRRGRRPLTDLLHYVHCTSLPARSLGPYLHHMAGAMVGAGHTDSSVADLVAHEVVASPSLAEVRDPFTLGASSVGCGGDHGANRHWRSGNWG